MMQPKEYTVWEHKHRPKKVADCILPTTTRNYLDDVVKNGLQQNLLMFGGAGTGKTTSALALCEELGLNYIFINASDERNIDVVRNQIKKFASSQSFGDKNGKPKVVILDEGDYLNPESTQPALRSFISEFAKNCRFILTCNYRNKLIEPLQSRFALIDFTIPKDEKKKILTKQLDVACGILDKEGVTYNKKVVAEVVVQCYPDFRNTLNELQKYSIVSGGNIDVGILASLTDVNIDTLSGYMKTKAFESVRKWVAENADNDPAILFRRLYEGLYGKLEKQSIPQMVVLLADYQYKAAFVADQHINMLACLTEIMMECNFV